MSGSRTWLRLTKQRPRRRTARPALERLEDRCVLSVVTEFPIPTPASGATAITRGADGNLWFTEFNADRIGRITTAGAASEPVLLTAGSGPLDIVSGPDGLLYFTERNTDRIGRINPLAANVQASLVEFLVPW